MDGDCVAGASGWNAREEGYVDRLVQLCLRIEVDVSCLVVRLSMRGALCLPAEGEKHPGVSVLGVHCGPTAGRLSLGLRVGGGNQDL